MDKLDIYLARILFQSGEFTEANIFQVPLEDDAWTIQLQRRDNGSTVSLNHARSTRPRIIKRLDTARRVVRDIGFREARIVMN